jgi:hypothetical protein
MNVFLPIDTVIYYLVFNLFLSIQQQYINWKDNIVKININPISELLLGLGCFANMITGLSFLIYCAIKLAWWKPIILSALTLIINGIIIGLLKIKIDFQFLVFPSILISFVFPFLGYLMFNSI